MGGFRSLSKRTNGYTSKILKFYLDMSEKPFFKIHALNNYEYKCTFLDYLNIYVSAVEAKVKHTWMASIDIYTNFKV